MCHYQIKWKRVKHCTWTIDFYTLQMLAILLNKIMRVKLRVLLWFVCIFTVFFLVTLWTYSDVNSVSETKIDSKYPVIVWWNMDFHGVSSIKYCSNGVKCNIYGKNDKAMQLYYNVGAYIFYASTLDFKNLPLPREPKDIIWGLFHEESPRNVEELLHEKALSLFNFSATFSRFSDVPYPLQHIDSFEDIRSKKYFIETSKKNELLNEIAPIMYLQSDCETSTERDAYVKELMKLIKVDSYGSCLNNKQMPPKFKDDYLNNLNEDEFLAFIARYKFVIAIENGACNDYVTEKFWRAIKVGSVPIYFGSPTIKDWLPNKKSAILLEDYPTPKKMFEHIQVLLHNDRLYEEYLEHKTKQLITNQRLLDEHSFRPYQYDGVKIIDKFECFICERLHDKINGQIGVHIVNKSHYDCPKPLSALTLKVNPDNTWVYSWEYAKSSAESIYERVINGYY
ncbi:alpha-(1,3)-fucosyltransferase 10 [Spodoptera frugiperda]|uniref:Fucosyltransferase n=2 Tax=Spodoptera frugiperda TaxID=7108 RepID=A0A9R0CX09_SPOFR|nr:alpha-(1,3)-fucosyltransferase 10 [Spodoptera frugiperda]XP_035432246.2 alpha-(1,3)-fucosyltransferase 10 [Spodoptera frugiperda]XP_035432247.2 alpha-(1,3)-fucosyltransferase 10 [Spodoptera frugiperda]